MSGWFPLSELLKYELIQAREEGRDVSWVEAQVQAVLAQNSEAAISAAYELLASLPLSADFPFEEPSDLETIRAQSPGFALLFKRANANPDWSDKFYGAWLGRCCGCALGKPLEIRPFTSGSGATPGWRLIYQWFDEAGKFPIEGYVPGFSPAAAATGLNQLRNEKSLSETIQFMESDDDIRYTVLGLTLLEKHGHAWSAWDVGKHWHNYLTYGQVCTAETQAYLNFAQVTCNTEGKYFPRRADWQSKLDWIRTYRNPFREWIGAQIRVDALAYGAAGNPELAAEFAWRDASFSHVKNGIYGAMFVAAMISAAFVESDNRRLVEIGLGVIPSNSRLARDIRQAIEITSACQTQLELVERIWAAFSHYDPFHTNNNAALVTAALLFAGDDFEKGITTAVLGGWDTDCNGATVGSILGAKLGAANIPDRWKEPLHDTLYAEIPGFHPISISECARRSELTWKNINDSATGGSND